MTASDTSDPPHELEPLLVAAFHAAQSRGKPDWRLMRTGVLKNRLLQMTDRKFDERKHGAGSFRELLAHYPHLLRIDGDDVELIAGEELREVKLRVRSDLWRAFMDYSSGQSYKWDTEQQRARPAQDGDSMIVPTLSSEEMAAWRNEFACMHSDDNKVDDWRAQAKGTNALPPPLQGPWTAFVRDRVTARISEWFKENGLDVDPLSSSRWTASGIAQTPTDKLRDLVSRCVAAMTAEELAALSLPPAAVLRVMAEGS